MVRANHPLSNQPQVALWTAIFNVFMIFFNPLHLEQNVAKHALF